MARAYSALITVEDVDPSVIGGSTDWKDACACATTAALPACTYNNGAGTLTGNANGALAAQDGVTPTAGMRVLVKNQASAFQNGPYEVTTVGDGSNAFVLTRTADANTAAELTNGAAVLVTGGTTQAGTQWFVNSTVTTLGTDSVTWVQISASGALSPGAVTTTYLADDAVTAAKIAADAVGSSEIAAGAVATAELADSSVTSAKIVDATIATGDLADDAVTFAKMQNITTDRLLGRDTASSGNVEELSVTNGLEFTGSTGLQVTASVRARAERATVFQTGGTTYAYNGSGSVISSLSTSAANNVTVIQAAIDDIDGTYNATGHAGGGVVRLADQNFATNAYLELKYGVSLVGWAAFDRNGLTGSAHSAVGTTITPTGISSVDVDGGATTTNRNPAILAGRGVSGSGTQSTTNPHGCGITGINIDMRAVTTGQGIVIADTQFFYVDRCNIFGASASGGKGVEVYSTNSPDDGAHGTRITNSMIAYCYVGIYASGSGSTDSFVTGCRIVQCVSKGIQLGAASGGGGWQISDNHMTAGTGTSCDHLDVDVPAQITHNYLDTCGGYHAILNGPAIMIGNIIKGNNGSADNVVAPIDMGSSGGRMSVVANNIAQLADTAYVALVRIGSTSGNTYRPVIMGNILLNDNGAISPLGIACTSAGAAIAETNAAMTVSTTGTNPYIYGNRIAQNAGF